MKIFIALIVGVVIGAGALWFYSSNQAKSSMRATGEKIEDATRSARDSIEQKFHELKLGTNDIKDELARTGQVVRRKAREAGQALADATADARITAAIKAKFVADPDVSALSISVNTTSGIVTLSGTVSSAEEISKAMLLAMETEGVTQVISTLQMMAKG